MIILPRIILTKCRNLLLRRNKRPDSRSLRGSSIWMSFRFFRGTAGCRQE